MGEVFPSLNKNNCAKIQAMALRSFPDFSFEFLCLHCAAPVPAVLAQAGTRVSTCPALFSGIVLKNLSFLKNEYSFHPQICRLSFQLAMPHQIWGEFIRSSFRFTNTLRTLKTEFHRDLP